MKTMLPYGVIPGDPYDSLVAKVLDFVDSISRAFEAAYHVPKALIVLDGIEGLINLLSGCASQLLSSARSRLWSNALLPRGGSWS